LKDDYDEEFDQNGLGVSDNLQKKERRQTLYDIGPPLTEEEK